MKTIYFGNTLVAISQLKPLPGDEVKLSRHDRESATVKDILQRLGLPAVVEHRQDGSPYLQDFNGNISITHSQEAVAVAIDPILRIGIDTETWRQQLERVKHKFLSIREREIYFSNRDLLRAWCMKEAAYKAAGIRGLELTEGIRLPGPGDGNIIQIPSHSLRLESIVVEQTENSATILCTPV